MKSMGSLRNSNLRLRLVRELDETYIFNDLKTEEDVDAFI